MLILVKKLGRDPKKTIYRAIGLFQCSFCGMIIKKRTDTTAASCGCHLTTRPIIHGDCGTRLYRIWQGIKSRCNSKTSSGYKYYGGRGIKVCKEWGNYQHFKQWALASGYKDCLEIDRKNTDNDYCPSNCRFITHAENSRNRRNQKLNREKVRRIRVEMSKGADPYVLAKEFEVTQHHILAVTRGDRWA